MTDHVLQQIVSKARDAKRGHWNVQSTGEKLASALVLNRADWLALMGYTIAEAIERVGPTWVARIPAAAKLIDAEGSDDD
ncbi:TPA: hypothetical protein ACRNL1_005383 [Pseudomonas aeruginosa]